jgi:hypothetical protein
MAMKPEPPPILIAKPCTADWSAMTGDDRHRLCAQCNKHVHNLSSFAPRALRRFVEERDGTECIAYVLRDDGTMITASRWTSLAKFAAHVRFGFLWALALMLPSLFSGCAQRAAESRHGLSKGTPMPGSPMPPQHRQAHHAPDGQIVLGEPPAMRPQMDIGRVKVKHE